jgi:hypothetical protein
MSFNTYNLLPLKMQAEVLLHSGVYLELIRPVGNLNIELYALREFYVEMYFDNVSGEPLFLKAINTLEELEPYLSLIEIDDLFETE